MNLTGNSLAKWWRLQLANRSEARLTEVMGVAESDAALEAALVLFERDADGQVVERPLGEYEFVLGLADREQREAALSVAEAGLVRLSYRCFPGYRPVVRGYQEVIAALYAGKGGEVGARLAKLGELRAVMVAKCERASDYLDWFEITRAKETSGEFQDYLELKRRLKAEQERGHDDRLGRYLDDIEGFYRRD